MENYKEYSYGSDVRATIAVNMYNSGENACVSHGICGAITVGYGDLDEYGYWEFPLPKEYWPDWLKIME